MYGSKIGWYHLIFLPLILLEMESGDPPFLGERLVDISHAHHVQPIPGPSNTVVIQLRKAVA